VQEDVELMLDLADVGPGDYLIDLGAGDGRIVITAAQRGAMGHGVELDRELVDLALARAREAEVEDRVTFIEGDIFDADLGAATVVTLYLMPEVNLRLRPKLLSELHAGTRVVSNSFDMGPWLPDRHATGRSSGGLLMWVVPAQVGGNWTISVGDARLHAAIVQQFQEITVTLGRGAHASEAFEVDLDGDRIGFVADAGGTRYAFSGRVASDRMAGIVQIHGSEETRLAAWTAARSGGRPD
jgi:SAM-dependent methyltransferase